jgi:hypothetical protein
VHAAALACAVLLAASCALPLRPGEMRVWRREADRAPRAFVRLRAGENYEQYGLIQVALPALGLAAGAVALSNLIRRQADFRFVYFVMAVLGVGFAVYHFVRLPEDVRNAAALFRAFEQSSAGYGAPHKWSVDLWNRVGLGAYVAFAASVGLLVAGMVFRGGLLPGHAQYEETTSRR